METERRKVSNALQGTSSVNPLINLTSWEILCQPFEHFEETFLQPV